MALDQREKIFITVVCLIAIGTLVVISGIVPGPWVEDTGTVAVHDADGEQIALIDVVVADTPRERYTGLGGHDSLDTGEGMLFVHRIERERTYVMRDMDFDIDIVFIGADRTITAIHHARAPEPDEDGENLRYSGRAKWVLEVPRGYTNQTGISVGDEVRIEYN